MLLLPLPNALDIYGRNRSLRLNVQAADPTQLQRAQDEVKPLAIRAMNPRSTAGVKLQRAVLGVAAPVSGKLGGLVGRLTRPPADRFALPEYPAA